MHPVICKICLYYLMNLIIIYQIIHNFFEYLELVTIY
jgi:hypothetical protein